MTDIHAVRERLGEFTNEQRAIVERIVAHLDDLATRYLAYAKGDDNWANRAAEEAKARDAVQALLADHARLQNEVSGSSQGSGQHLCGSRDEASVGATAALAHGFTDPETLAFQLECIRRSIQADMRYSLNGESPATASPDKHIIPRCWLPLAAARNWVRTLLAAEEATRVVPAIPLLNDGGEAVHSQQSDQAPAEPKNHPPQPIKGE
ncbi:hypothetical protein [Caulobacter phage KcrB]|nr:hypothetical protein RW_GP031 [Caulobacter phage RW]WCA46335.1 hypothetical protein [Caulobacter phage KcrB]WCD56270.1 hypothetical protein [Caulobacter phage RLK]WNV48062.1 hypothetical protein GB2A_gp030 [Caulobacter phage GB2A]